MTVKQLLDQKGGGRIITIGPHVEVLQAAQILRVEGIGALIVSRDGTTLEGLLSERDIIWGLAELAPM